MRRTILIPAAVFGVYMLAAWLGPQNMGMVAYAGGWTGVRTLHVGTILPAGFTVVGDSDMTVRDEETVRQTFDLGTGAHSIDLDNVEGNIEVTGTDSNQVTMVVRKSYRAETQARLDAARREVKLDVKHEGGSLILFVDGPFRCWCGDGNRRSINYRGNLGYRVKMDFELQVPRNTDFRLSTVNSGEVRVRDLRGAYAVRNVNGGIEMTGVAGSGSAHTVNGAVKVVFRENPREASSFKSINGDIDLYFVRGLSADFRFKTFNGNIYSDFPVTATPVRGMEQVREGRKTIFRSDRFTGGRIGSGGVEIRTENLNGDIRIRENQ